MHAWSFHIFSILEHSYSVNNIMCTCISSFWKKRYTAELLLKRICTFEPFWIKRKSTISTHLYIEHWTYDGLCWVTIRYLNDYRSFYLSLLTPWWRTWRQSSRNRPCVPRLSSSAGMICFARNFFYFAGNITWLNDWSNLIKRTEVCNCLAPLL